MRLNENILKDVIMDLMGGRTEVMDGRDIGSIGELKEFALNLFHGTADVEDLSDLPTPIIKIYRKEPDTPGKGKEIWGVYMKLHLDDGKYRTVFSLSKDYPDVRKQVGKIFSRVFGTRWTSGENSDFWLHAMLFDESDFHDVTRLFRIIKKILESYGIE